MEKNSYVTQYKDPDWSNNVGKAEEIANQNPDIDSFFYVKGHRLVLKDTRGAAVFFKGEP